MVAVNIDINSSRFDGVTFVERLEDLRKQLGWTWSEWERQAKLNPRHLSAILNRARARADFRPDWTTLRALAKAASVTPEWLAEGDGDAALSPKQSTPVTRLERDPVPHLDTSHLSRPLDRAIGHAFDPKRHDWADGQAVIQALDGLNRHDRPEADLIEAARRWLDAAHDLRREGIPVTAETLLDRITFGKGPVRPGPDEASEAMQRQVVEHAAKEGVTFGEGAAAIEAFRRGGKQSSDSATKKGDQR